MKNTESQKPLSDSDLASKLIAKKLKYAKITRLFLILAVILVFFLTYKYLALKSQMLEDKIEYNNSVAECKPTDELEIQAKDYITGYVQGIYETDYPFLGKLLIFLGTIYLIQIALSIFGDAVEILLIVGLAVYKFFKWIKEKFKKEKSLNTSGTYGND